MEQKEIVEKLKVLIGQSMPDVDVDNVTLESRLVEDLQFDSLGIMMLAMSIEDEFGVSFNEQAIFKTVGDVVKYIQENSK